MLLVIVLSYFVICRMCPNFEVKMFVYREHSTILLFGDFGV